MLSFYDLNITNLIVLIVVAFITYIILDTQDSDTEKKNTVKFFIISLISGFVTSVAVSYATLEGDSISESNYWD